MSDTSPKEKLASLEALLTPEAIAAMCAAGASNRRKAAQRKDPNNLSYWFPLLEAAGLPVPQTRILTLTGDYWRLLDPQPLPERDQLVTEISAAAQELGLPAFLRTGHGSGKHEWRHTCHLLSADPETVSRHVWALAEWSECCGFIGLPYGTWVVREFLPGPAEFVWDGFEGMPVRREFRAFVADADVRCLHPYWPEGAFQGRLTPEQAAALARMNEPGADEPALRDLASRAGAALAGEWSIDLLWTERGWYITDCAVASESYHWPGCPHSSTPEPEVECFDGIDYAAMVERVAPEATP